MLHFSDEKYQQMCLPIFPKFYEKISSKIIFQGVCKTRLTNFYKIEIDFN